MAECEYCGCKQTIPNLDSEKKLTSALPAMPAASGAEALLKRAWMFLEDQEWKNAGEYFDKVLDNDPECARAYIGKLCVEQEKPSLADIAEKDSYADELEASGNFRRALRFADSALRAELEQCLESVKQNQKLRREEEDCCHRETIARLKPLQERAAKAARFIAVGFWHTVGLKSDGTVVAEGNHDSGQCDVAGWQDIVAVAANAHYTLGLKSDGTVVATEYTGKYDYGQCNVGGWRGIVAVAAGFSHAVGLKSDGTVVAVGDNYNHKCSVGGWRNIVAVAAGDAHTVGLKSDGMAVAVGASYDDKYAVGGWKLFNSIDTLAQECEEVKYERQAKISAMESEKQSLQTELTNLKGLFTGKRRKEIEARLAELESELKNA